MAYPNKAPFNSNAPAPKPPSISDLPISRAAARRYEFDDTQVSLILSVVPPTAKDHEVAAFLYQAARTKLDPMSRQIYLVSRQGKCTVQTGIDGYRLVADRTGQYVGSDDPIYDEGLTQYQWLKAGRDVPETATVSVYKAIGSHVGKFTATAAWDAYFPGDAQGFMWKKMPLLMLAKCAEALALRKAYPAELSGIYISEEMMQSGEGVGDVAIENLTKELGVQNQHALAVLEKLAELNIAEDDERIVAMIGYTVRTVPSTAEGSELLKKVWSAAALIKKGTSADDAFVVVSQ